MRYLLVWFLVGALLGLWSLGIWALQAVGTWTVVQAGTLGGVAVGAGPAAWPLWLQAWLPGEWLQTLQPLWSGLVGAVQWLFELAPGLAGGLTALAWLLWSLGAMALLALGVAAHLGLAWWRRRAVHPQPFPRSARLVTPGRHTA